MFRYGIETQNFSLEKTNYENDKPSIIKICKYTSRHYCPKNNISAIAMPHPENVFTIYFNYLIRGTAHVFLKLPSPSPSQIRYTAVDVTDKRQKEGYAFSNTSYNPPILRIWIKEMLRTHCLQSAFSRMLWHSKLWELDSKRIFCRLRWHL